MKKIAAQPSKNHMVRHGRKASKPPNPPHGSNSVERSGPEINELPPAITNTDQVGHQPTVIDSLKGFRPKLQEAFSLFEHERDPVIDWEVAFAQRIVCDGAGFEHGYLVGMAEALGVSTAEMLSQLTLLDGTPAITKPSGEAEERERSAYLLGAKAGEYSFLDTLEGNRAFNESLVGQEPHPDGLSALADARSLHGISGEGPEAVAFDRGWWSCMHGYPRQMAEVEERIWQSGERREGERRQRDADRAERLRTRVRHGHALRGLRHRCGFALAGLSSLTGVAKQRLFDAEGQRVTLDPAEIERLMEVFQRVSAALGFDAAA